MEHTTRHRALDASEDDWKDRLLADFHREPLSQVRNKLILICGAQGAGKTTLAKWLKRQLGYKYFEADYYMVDRDGNYAYDRAKLPEAHRKCREEVAAKLALKEGCICSNTNTTFAAMEEYITMAHIFDAYLVLIFLHTEHRNVHGVPEDVVRRKQEELRREEAAFYRSHYDVDMIYSIR